jgi:DNA-binding MarR family transcriptional regulator
MFVSGVETLIAVLSARRHARIGDVVHREYDTSIEVEAFNRLLAMSSRIADDMARGLHARGLTQARATLLWVVAEHGPLTQRQIAERLHVTPRNVTTLIDALERDGFVVRAEHERDRRAVSVHLTQKGTAATGRMKSEATALAHDLFADLPREDLATVIRAFDRIAARFAGDVPAAAYRNDVSAAD